MNYIERIMGRINKLTGQVVSEYDIKTCFNRDDVEIEEIECGYVSTYNAYVKGEKGIIQYVLEDSRLYDVYILDEE